MATRYDDRDDERREQNYGRGWNSDYGRSGEERSRMRSRYDRDEGERYSNEDRWQSRYGSTGRGYDTARRYDEGSSMRSQRYNYPSGSRTRETYGGHGAYEDSGSRYLREQGRESDYDRRYGYGEGYGSADRGWWDRASDEVASWFGDEDAARRRRMDQQREEYRGRGPRNYRRSDDRIKEDINDRLSEGYLDASDIEVAVQSTEVVLTGTVNSRADKRRAEAVAESVTGVTNVENRLRVKQSDYGRYSGTELSGTTSTTGTTTGTAGTTGTTGTSTRRAGTGS